MADDKSGREKQSDDAERRQRERAIRDELERGDEPEPPVDPAELADLETELDTVAFPATGSAVVAAIGDRDVDSVDGTYPVADLIPESDEVTLDTPADVRRHLQRPTVAATMTRIVDASKGLEKETLRGSQWDAYRKTFRALADIDADDDDEAIETIEAWILDQISDKGKLPGSRAVRRQAAKVCREKGYRVRANDWLGI